jgi:hypothetical protein
MPPSSVQTDQSSHEQPSLRLWNPNASALWGIVFTPVFSTYLHLQNWKALTEPEHQKQAQRWFVGSIIWVIVALLVARADVRLPLFHLLFWAFLIVWYFASGRVQRRYIIEKFGATYSRKPILKALFVTLCLLVLLGFVLGFVFAAFFRT